MESGANVDTDGVEMGSQATVEDDARAATATSHRKPPRAQFVLEGAQVSCQHGENALSAADIFLVRGRDGVVGTINVAQEAVRLVHAVRRRTAYTPILAVAPTTSRRGSRLSTSRKRRLLALHAEKKALAGQLALGYDSPRLVVPHRMCADCHAFFEAASRDAGRPIVCTDARVRHEFVDGRCSCGATHLS
eukprot:CAMPEP_0174728048 /NCGR_PEP_ID=MMETSP1094-20130205/50982_1 /TAXON_ID=156173 /ORGANISM="Chrysochromulina brevifilum, Strain UTEX LB 985" /LENGTH=190 /DNA_ID=CAMNT_0015929899 /DNA_START=15 /DNA_END=587 /DNA_ORIENTATION=+